MKWPGAVTLVAVVVGISVTQFSGVLQGQQVVQLWAAVLATIVALYQRTGAKIRVDSDPPPPADRLWPLAVFASPGAVDLATSVSSLGSL